VTVEGDFKIGRRGGVCSVCAKALGPGEPASSALYRSSSGESSFERRDFCAPCFEAPERRGDPFSWWTAVVPQPEEKKALFDTGVAREFLLRLFQENAPERASLRYLLTLLLLRKKLVKVTDQFVRDGVEVMIAHVPPDETAYEVPCLELDEAETTKLREELGRLFAL
jgi:hypothetical protein